MTHIYLPVPSQGYEWVVPRDPDELEALDALSRTRTGDTERPISVESVLFDDLGRSRPKADVPWIGFGTFALRPRAVDVLSELLLSNGRFCPLAHESAEKLWLFVVTRVVDALDEQRSEIARFADGRVLNVRRYAFRADKVGSFPIFAIPQLQDAFASQDLVDRFRQAGLTGVDFREVWASAP